MSVYTHHAFGRRLCRFAQDAEGSVVPLLALVAIPLMGLMGAATDYSRAATVRAKLQASLDAALLAGIKDGTSNWSTVALALFNADAAGTGANVDSPNFNSNGSGGYSATVSGSVPTMFMSMLSFSSIPVAASSAAISGNPEQSCILTYDSGHPLSNVGVNFGGAPSVSLTGCAVRSNTSVNCNGHSGGANASIAAGTTSGCSNPHSYAQVVPDIYASVISNITAQCGGVNPGVSWNASVSTIPSAVRVVTKTNYTEYHVCGDLALSGTGTLISNSPSADSVIVIENGGLTLANNASVSTLRTAIVMTGSGTTGGVIDFPNGNGHSATLSLSPPLTAGNPWQGIALYQDPRQTTLVSDNWGPGATFRADGVVYLPYADLSMSGIAASNDYQCTKVATHTFATNGNVSLTFAQATAGCTTINMKQWNEAALHLTQ